MIRQSIFDEENGWWLLCGERGKGAFKMCTTNEQTHDMALVFKYIYKVFGKDIKFTHVPEYCQKIVDQTKKCLNGKFREPNVYFDLVIFITTAKGTFGFIVESDGASHYDDDFCKNKLKTPTTLEEVLRKDRAKNIWAAENNIPIIRLSHDPERFSENDRIRYLIYRLLQIKKEIC